MSSESCAACGKGDVDISLKSCKACKLVKYCGVDCQVAHRSSHKKACRIRVAELFDMKLFAQPPPREECPICMLTLPVSKGGKNYMVCCGKFICLGCWYCLPREQCPFCNTLAPENDKEMIEMLMERIERFNDAHAMLTLGSFYERGRHGFDINDSKVVEMYQRASELGYAEAHFNLGVAYEDGLGLGGVTPDKKKSIHHYQLAAMMGDMDARCNLAANEGQDGNEDRSMRHFMIAAKCGHDNSLNMIKQGFTAGIVTKEDFEKTLRAKASQDETKSERRDRATALEG